MSHFGFNFLLFLLVAIVKNEIIYMYIVAGYKVVNLWLFKSIKVDKIINNLCGPFSDVISVCCTLKEGDAQRDNTFQKDYSS